MVATIRDPIGAVLSTARLFLGQVEEPGNRGWVPDFANAWIGHFDMRPYKQGMLGAPWCSSWANLVGWLAIGVAWPVPRSPRFSDVDEMVNWARDRGVLYEKPERGDLGAVKGGVGYVHIFFVTQADDSRVGTVEGNTNDTGSPNGTSVLARGRRTNSSVYIRWAELLTS